MRRSASVSEDRCDDADYVPQAESESDHSEDDEVNENSDDCSNQAEEIPISSTPKLNSPAVNVDDFAGAVDVREIPDVSNAELAKRYFCAFCNKRPIKYARHLITVHKDKEEVKEFAKLPAKSQERQELIAKLHHDHALIFNRSEMTKDKGLQVGRRPNKHSSRKSANSYVSCPNCYKFVVKLNLRHHYKICSHDKPTNCRGILAQSRRIMGRMHKSANSVVKNSIFPFLRDDDITAEILYDELIILYANTLSEKYPTEEDHAMIRQKLRTIGRFLKVVKDINPEIKNLSNLFTAKNFDLCIEGVNKVAGISEDYCVFRSPTTATSIRTLLKKVGIFLETLYIKREENEKKKQVKDFLKLIEKGFEIINRRAAETLVRRKRLKHNVLPSKDDIQKFTLYLEEKRMQAFEKLQKKFRYDYWLQLSEMTLLAIQVFNRRRQGEVSKMKIEDYRAYKRLDKKTDRDMYENLSEKCKTIAETYVRFEIRGKLGRTVGILLRDEILQSVEVILTFRNIAGVPEDNPYVFGLKPSNDRRHKRLYAYELMRKHSGLCGAEIPESLRGTKLRKHIATLCAEYNLSDSELVDLANFLGHAAKIHQSHYRQQAARDIVGVSQFLEAASRKDAPANIGSSHHNTGRATRQRDADGTLTSQTSQDTSAVPTDHDESFSSNVGDDCRPVVPVSNSNGIRQRNQRLRTVPASGSDTDEDDPSKKKMRPCRRVAPSESGSDENEPPSKKRRLCRRVAWDSSEIDIIKRNFGSHLSKMTYPPKTEIEAVIAANKDVLGRRHYKHIKAWMSNQYKLLKHK